MTPTPASLPLVGVVLGYGAATPLGILAAARGLCRVVFLCDRTLPYVDRLAESIADLAAVHDISGMSVADLRGTARHLGLDGVTTFSESMIRGTAEVARGSGLAYLTTETALLVTDKYAQRRAMARAGVDATRFRVLAPTDDLAGALDEVGLPAVLKPRSAAGSAYTCRVDTPAEAADRLRGFRGRMGTGAEFVLEELLRGDPCVAGPGWGDYVSVESVTSDGHLTHVEITGKFPLAPPFRETGYVIPARLPAAWRQPVFDLAGDAVRALGVTHGVTHAELKLTPHGPRVIEVNGRVGGYVTEILRRARGLDLVRIALSAALGCGPHLPPAAYRRHAFQYFLTPPMRRLTLRRLDGVEALAGHPGIHLVEILKRPGDAVDWRDGTLAYLGIVHGSAPDHDEVLRLVALADRTIRAGYGGPAAGGGPDGSGDRG